MRPLHHLAFQLGDQLLHSVSNTIDQQPIPFEGEFIGVQVILTASPDADVTITATNTWGTNSTFVIPSGAAAYTPLFYVPSPRLHLAQGDEIALQSDGNSVATGEIKLVGILAGAFNLSRYWTRSYHAFGGTAGIKSTGYVIPEYGKVVGGWFQSDAVTTGAPATFDIIKNAADTGVDFVLSSNMPGAGLGSALWAPADGTVYVAPGDLLQFETNGELDGNPLLYATIEYTREHAGGADTPLHGLRRHYVQSGLINLDVPSERNEKGGGPGITGQKGVLSQICVHVNGATPDVNAVLSIYKNNVDTGATITVPTTHLVNTGAAYVPSLQVTVEEGDLIELETDGGPTNTPDGHFFFMVDP